MIAQLFVLAQATAVSFLFAAAFRWEGPVVLRIGMVVVAVALALGILVFYWWAARAVPPQDAVLEIPSRSRGVSGATFSVAYVFVVLCFTYILVMIWPANDMSPPIADGHYTFVVRFAEDRNMTGGHLDAEIRGRHIRFTSKPDSSVFPPGIVEEGILLWHTASKQWIVGQKEADAEIAEVGGCSDGPFVVDLEQKVFWTC